MSTPNKRFGHIAKPQFPDSPPPPVSVNAPDAKEPVDDTPTMQNQTVRPPPNLDHTHFMAKVARKGARMGDDYNESNQDLKIDFLGQQPKIPLEGRGESGGMAAILARGNQKSPPEDMLSAGTKKNDRQLISNKSIAMATVDTEEENAKISEEKNVQVTGQVGLYLAGSGDQRVPMQDICKTCNSVDSVGSAIKGFDNSARSVNSRENVIHDELDCSVAEGLDSNPTEATELVETTLGISGAVDAEASMTIVGQSEDDNAGLPVPVEMIASTFEAEEDLGNKLHIEEGLDNTETGPLHPSMMEDLYRRTHELNKRISLGNECFPSAPPDPFKLSDDDVDDDELKKDVDKAPGIESTMAASREYISINMVAVLDSTEHPTIVSESIDPEETLPVTRRVRDNLGVGYDDTSGRPPADVEGNGDPPQVNVGGDLAHDVPGVVLARVSASGTRAHIGQEPLRDSALRIPTAFAVHDEIIIATPLEQRLQSWKRRWVILIFSIICHVAVVLSTKAKTEVKVITEMTTRTIVGSSGASLSGFPSSSASSSPAPSEPLSLSPAYDLSSSLSVVPSDTPPRHSTYITSSSPSENRSSSILPSLSDRPSVEPSPVSSLTPTMISSPSVALLEGMFSIECDPACYPQVAMFEDTAVVIRDEIDIQFFSLGNATSELITKIDIDYEAWTASIHANTTVVVPTYETKIHVYEKGLQGIWDHTADIDIGIDVPKGGLVQIDTDVGRDIVVVGVRPKSIGLSLQGSIYIYRRKGASWIEEAKLNHPSDSDASSFRNFVSVSGNTIAVGDPYYGGNDGGAVFVYEYKSSSNSWNQLGNILVNHDCAEGLGDIVRLMGDSKLLVSCLNPDSVYYYKKQDMGDKYILQENISGFDNEVDSISGDANAIVISEDRGRKSNVIHFYTSINNLWEEVNIIDDPRLHGSFGERVASNGNTALIASYRDVYPIVEHFSISFPLLSEETAGPPTELCDCDDEVEDDEVEDDEVEGVEVEDVEVANDLSPPINDKGMDSQPVVSGEEEAGELSLEVLVLIILAVICIPVAVLAISIQEDWEREMHATSRRDQCHARF